MRSSLNSSCAIMWVSARSVICRVRITITSWNGSSLVSMIRRGNGSPGTMMGGDGNRASTEKRVGMERVGGVGPPLRRTEKKRRLVGECAADWGVVMNSCFRRANVSAVVGGGRGGSKGRKTMGSCCVRAILVLFSLLCSSPFPSAPLPLQKIED